MANFEELKNDFIKSQASKFGLKPIYLNVVKTGLIDYELREFANLLDENCVWNYQLFNKFANALIGDYCFNNPEYLQENQFTNEEYDRLELNCLDDDLYITSKSYNSCDIGIDPLSDLDDRIKFWEKEAKPDWIEQQRKLRHIPEDKIDKNTHFNFSCQIVKQDGKYVLSYDILNDKGSFEFESSTGDLDGTFKAIKDEIVKIVEKELVLL